MAFSFNKAFNKFAEVGTSLNRGANQIIGKEVFKDIKPIEAPREFPPFDTYPQYEVTEPPQWTKLDGEIREFEIDGCKLHISANLDACIQYRKYFKESARYYTDRFIFKYNNCVKDFDSFVFYFKDLYFDGLLAMTQRAYDLLLPFGVFSADTNTFADKQINTYRKAADAFETMLGIELSKNEQANNLGNQIGGAVQMRGGGFGLKGAAKGMAQAEAFNIGMNLLGKFVAQQNQMTQEEKANVFSLFNQELFFEEVYSDYYNVFLTFVETLAENGVIDNFSTGNTKEFEITMRNLQNPLFPQDKLVETILKIIATTPFNPECINLLEQKVGLTEEIIKLKDYLSC